MDIEKDCVLFCLKCTEINGCVTFYYSDILYQHLLLLLQCSDWKSFIWNVRDQKCSGFLNLFLFWNSWMYIMRFLRKGTQIFFAKFYVYESVFSSSTMGNAPSSLFSPFFSFPLSHFLPSLGLFLDSSLDTTLIYVLHIPYTCSLKVILYIFSVFAFWWWCVIWSWVWNFPPFAIMLALKNFWIWSILEFSLGALLQDLTGSQTRGHFVGCMKRSWNKSRNYGLTEWAQ